METGCPLVPVFCFGQVVFSKKNDNAFMGNSITSMDRLSSIYASLLFIPVLAVCMISISHWDVKFYHDFGCWMRRYRSFVLTCAFLVRIISHFSGHLLGKQSNVYRWLKPRRNGKVYSEISKALKCTPILFWGLYGYQPNPSFSFYYKDKSSPWISPTKVTTGLL